MKKSISILFCLFMFPLFLNTSQVNAQSSVPSCLSFKSGDHAARIECFKKNEKEFRARIIELRRKHNIEQVNYDSFGESCPSRSPGDHAARLECFKNNDNAYQAIINELMATKEGSAVDFNNEAKRFQESTTEGQHIQQLEAKISDLEGKLANAVLTEDAFKECDKRNNHNKATISILDENSEKLRQSGSCLKNKITDYASAIKVVPHSTPALESYRNDVVDELGIFIKSCE